MSDMRASCLECGAPLLEDPDHDAFDTAVHACVIDEWLWFDYEPPELESASDFERPVSDCNTASSG
jgi:hypothetical protein